VLPRSEVFDLYSKVGCLIFSSRLETWGMPLSEFKEFKKPIIVSNLDYAKETIGAYDKVKFFNPLDEIELFNHVVDYLEGRLTYDLTEEVPPLTSCSNTWNELFKMIYF
jgi:glycosyltransferase involved in cell wall biosynthesis